MSGKFTSTATSLPNSSILRQEDYIREIVQSEFLFLFEDIKVEIETKIKSIDKNITQLRLDLARLHQQGKPQGLHEVLEKIEKVEAEVQLLRYHQQF